MQIDDGVCSTYITSKPYYGVCQQNSQFKAYFAPPLPRVGHNPGHVLALLAVRLDADVP